MINVEGRGEFAVVTQKTSWIQEMISGRKSNVQTRDTITLLLKELRSKKCQEEEESAATAGRRRASSRNDAVAELALTDPEDDDDEESDAPANRSARVHFPNTFRIHTVNVNGHDICFAYFKRKYFISATQENLDSFVQAALAYDKPEVKKRKAERAQSRQDGDSPAGATKKAVRWVACRQSYVISYTDPDGTSRTFSRGLAPKVQHPDGSALSKAEYSAELRRAWKKARSTWNDMDKSELPRLAATD